MQTPTPPPAQPTAQMQAVLDKHAALGAQPLETLTPAQARQQPTPADAVRGVLQDQGRSTAPEAVANVVDRTIPGPAGSIAIRVYTPAGAGPFPVIVYYHGGGWVIADLDVYDSSPRALANAAGAVVVSSHYRQGPEHRFPAAHDDAYAAYKWTLANAASINGDPRRVAVVGESAGGGLATTVARLAKQDGIQLPVHQVLIYPITNHDLNTPSYLENANATPLSRAGMAWFFSHYLRSPADGNDPRISPLRANDLQGLPSATIITAEIDPLRSEGAAYAERLRAAGVAVDYRNYDNVTHEFFGMGAVVDEARAAVQQAATGLRRAFGI